MSEYTHMPFLTRDRCGRRTLFYCRSNPPPVDRGLVWKLWISDPDGDRRIHTGFGEEVVECSPAAWEDDSGWHVSFIAGGAKQHPLFRLWRMDGPTADRLGPPQIVHAPTPAGCVFRDRMVYVEPHETICICRSAGIVRLVLRGAMIVRVSYRADAPVNLLISATLPHGEEPFTFEYDLLSGAQEMLECDGSPAYKCTIFQDEILYARRGGEGFEDRRIVRGLETIRYPMIKHRLERIAPIGRR